MTSPAFARDDMFENALDLAMGTREGERFERFTDHGDQDNLSGDPT